MPRCKRRKTPLQDRANQSADEDLRREKTLCPWHRDHRQRRKRPDCGVRKVPVSEGRMASRSAHAQFSKRSTRCDLRHQEGFLRTDRYPRRCCSSLSRLQRNNPPDWFSLCDSREPGTDAKKKET